MDQRNRMFNVILGLVVVAAIAGAGLGGCWIWLHYACKPLATLLLLGLAWRARAPVSARYRRLLVAGLALSLVGDICLMLPVDAFLPGLVAFLLAHLCYIAAFFPGSTARLKWLCLMLFGLFAALNVIGLWPKLELAMRLPVLAYVLVLTAMAALALARWRGLLVDSAAQTLQNSAARAAVGAALFVVSDSVLAWDRFGGGIAWAPLWVLGTYYAAQWCIAGSVELQGSSRRDSR